MISASIFAACIATSGCQTISEPRAQKLVNYFSEDLETEYAYDVPFVKYKCRSRGITKSKLNVVLSSGAKVISTSKWRETVYTDSGARGVCHGTSYILEGSMKLLHNM